MRAFFLWVIRVFHGHVWDVSPGYRRGSQMECVRCGMHAEPVAGLRA